MKHLILYLLAILLLVETIIDLCLEDVDYTYVSSTILIGILIWLLIDHLKNRNGNGNSS